MPRTREFLTDRERMLLSKPEELQKLSPGERGSFFRDERLKATSLIEALTFLVEYLPEKKQAKVFTPEIILSLTSRFLNADPDRRTSRHYRLAQEVALYSLSILKGKLVGQKFGTILSEDLERIQEIIRLILQPEK